MNIDVQLDPFVLTPPSVEAEHTIEAAWFDAPRRSSRIPRSQPPSRPPSTPPIDDPLADRWFR
jgi:hypothetical protein